MYYLKAIGILLLIFVAWIAAYGVAAVLVTCLCIHALATLMRMEEENVKSRKHRNTTDKDTTRDR
jgi:hypothetical protein